jgi:hypothetical protein
VVTGTEERAGASSAIPAQVGDDLLVRVRRDERRGTAVRGRRRGQAHYRPAAADDASTERGDPVVRTNGQASARHWTRAAR